MLAKLLATSPILALPCHKDSSAVCVGGDRQQITVDTSTYHTVIIITPDLNLFMSSLPSELVSCTDKRS